MPGKLVGVVKSWQLPRLQYVALGSFASRVGGFAAAALPLERPVAPAATNTPAPVSPCSSSSLMRPTVATHDREPV